MCRCRFLALTCLFLSPPLMADSVDETYLEAIKADVAEFTGGGFDSQNKSRWVPDGAQQNISGVSVDKLQEFKVLLLKKMPGSYIRYSQLPGWQQAEIMQIYYQTGDLKRVKREILETLP